MSSEVPFQPKRSCKSALQASFSKLIEEKHRALTASIMSPQNMLRYSHGSKWRHPANPYDPDDSEMESHSAEVTLPFSRVVSGDVSVLLESIDNLSQEFHGQLMRSMYALINRTCDRTGNTVQAGKRSFAEAFEEMLRKIEFSVDESGEVTLPQLHTGDARWVLQSLEEQPPEYHQRIEQLIEQKSAQAREQEALRKAKFKGGDR